MQRRLHILQIAITVSVIDTATNTVTATVPVGIQPYGVAISLDGTKVYVTHPGSYTVSVIDAATNTLLTTVKVGAVSGADIDPRGIAKAPKMEQRYMWRKMAMALFP